MLLQADARALPLAGASVQCVVTSPPYWGLRDYGLPPAVWDGDPACAHVWGEDGASAQRLRNGEGSDTAKQAVPLTLHPSTGAFCSRCPAWRGTLGLEPTPELYVAHMVQVFREVWRVLRDDGTCWLNLGDSYAGGGGFSPDAPSNRNGAKQTTMRGAFGARGLPVTSGLKPKDLVGIPWRVAFALQADGWWLRADVIWSKPNPMPESVTDRPTKAHEYLFLLAKSERYFYDAEAIREPQTGNTHDPGQRDNPKITTPGNGIKNNSSFAPAISRYVIVPGGRNRRSVWTIATEPYPEAHFATFPEALVVPCIQAGTSEAGACATCGAPWERMTERTGAALQKFYAGAAEHGADGRRMMRHGQFVAEVHTTGWRPTCAHADAPRVPCLVLDPFGGTATVGAVAERLGRRWIATDLKPEYLALARRRTAQRGFVFLEAPASSNGHGPCRSSRLSNPDPMRVG